MFFDTITSIQNLKKKYRELAYQHHPDHGGDEDMMKRINTEYEKVLVRLQRDGGVKKDASGKEYGHSVDDGFREIIVKICNLEGLEIEICGCWIWVSGNTYRFKKELKEAGFFFSGKKKMWYWRPEDAASKKRWGNMDIEDIRMKYGSIGVSADRQGTIRPLLHNESA